MKSDCINILIKKRNIELECLGISPKLYYLVCKFIDRHVRVTIKDNSVFVFRQNIDNNKEKYITAKVISDDIKEAFGVNSSEALLIVNEWLRDSVINLRMSADVTKNWEFISLPKEYIELDDDFNF